MHLLGHDVAVHTGADRANNGHIYNRLGGVSGNLVKKNRDRHPQSIGNFYKRFIGWADIFFSYLLYKLLEIPTFSASWTCDNPRAKRNERNLSHSIKTSL